jgi:hypothetical protein
MRLLHTETLELAEFIGEARPKYAILSHTWGSEEVLFQDMQRGRRGLLASKKAGRDKVLRAAAVAKQNNLLYIWIDTCCIDKSSSAELSEAINSMFAWYNKAAVCYAYIADFDSTRPWSGPLSATRWLKRGWTLQELIAPTRVDFYDKNWVYFGDRASLATSLSHTARIDELALRWHREQECPANLEKNRAAGKDAPTYLLPWVPCRFCCRNVSDMLESFSVATRMSWASHRKTTREEDTAYSLLGIFGVNMPLLYGEGSAAFLRLQHEIVRKSTDQSIFAWSKDYFVETDQSSPKECLRTVLFARSPSWFHPPLYFPTDKQGGPLAPMLLSSVGVEIDVHIAPFKDMEGLWIAILDCAGVGDSLTSPALLLRETSSTSRIRAFTRQMLPSGRSLFPVNGSHDIVWISQVPVCWFILLSTL